MQIMGGKCHKNEAISVSKDTDHFATGHPTAACSNWFK